MVNFGALEDQYITSSKREDIFTFLEVVFQLDNTHDFVEYDPNSLCPEKHPLFSAIVLLKIPVFFHNMSPLGACYESDCWMIHPNFMKKMKKRGWSKLRVVLFSNNISPSQSNTTPTRYQQPLSSPKPIP